MKNFSIPSRRLRFRGDISRLLLNISHWQIHFIAMAAKRISSTSINWTAFGERVSKQEMQYFQALKGRNDSYLRRIAVNPSSLPKIDWNYYKSKISVPGMVDNFQKSYEALSIPYPGDQGLIAKINDQEAESKARLAEFVTKVTGAIAEHKKKLEVLEAQLPIYEMTVEEYFIAYPEFALYPVNPPTFYPHEKKDFEFTRKLVESGKL